ncbi:leucine-rich repeat receptor-like protein kinase PXC2 [Brassica rapa]|uniref:leucine-rich repeat receptor-like protein kinase PXC2 n=1 Tax=Brassica campestris TaxID=3711 RepID=UPI0004F1D2BF|nr:leucine-rich repeat receptor-like protein kinase PXC2 [Brassica rapa]
MKKSTNRNPAFRHVITALYFSLHHKPLISSDSSRLELINRRLCELGRGGIGVVYKTSLQEGRPVAVKKLTDSGLIKSQEEFEREMRKLGKLMHKNIIKIKGYYWTQSLQLLSYEFVSGEAYTDISMGTSACVLSGKVKSTLGYTALKFACRTVKITEKCDVYGFGILVLEVVTGKRPVEYAEDDVMVLSETVREGLEEGRVEEFVDGRLRANFPAEEAIPVLKLGLVCGS